MRRLLQRAAVPASFVGFLPAASRPAVVRDRGLGLRTAGLDQMLALTGTARRWEPKRLRLRLFSAAGRLVRSRRRLRLRLAARWPRAAEITAAATRLQALPSG